MQIPRDRALLVELKRIMILVEVARVPLVNYAGRHQLLLAVRALLELGRLVLRHHVPPIVELIELLQRRRLVRHCALLAAQRLASGLWVAQSLFAGRDVLATGLAVVRAARQFVVRHDGASVLLALLADDVRHLAAVAVGRGRVAVVHVVLQRERAQGVALLLVGGRSDLVGELRGGRRGLRLRVAALERVPVVALFVIDVVKPLRPLVQPQSQVLGFAEIVQVHVVVVAGESPVDA